jgi:hypothetical protein
MASPQEHNAARQIIQSHLDQLCASRPEMFHNPHYVCVDRIEAMMNAFLDLGFKSQPDLTYIEKVSAPSIVGVFIRDFDNKIQAIEHLSKTQHEHLDTTQLSQAQVMTALSSSLNEAAEFSTRIGNIFGSIPGALPTNESQTDIDRLRSLTSTSIQVPPPINRATLRLISSYLREELINSILTKLWLQIRFGDCHR